MKSLNVLQPTHHVKATDSISTMIRIIRVLIDKDFAYQANGNVYFAVQKDKEYGKLSGFSEREMKVLLKERGGDPNDPLKRNPLDFLLWQKSKSDEPNWESPWGKGRPGWHIECSAMNLEYSGKQIDIHGGGHDLIYPHHESEIAQSESFTGKVPFTKYWIHTAMLKYQGEKMSKSKGNLVMVSDLLKNYSPNAIRYLLLSHYYREDWEFTKSQLDMAEKTIGIIINDSDSSSIIADLDDDFNIPLALLQKKLSKEDLVMLGFVV